MQISPECEILSECYLCGSQEATIQSRVSCNTGVYLQKVLCGGCGLIFSQVRPKWQYAIDHLYSKTEYRDADNPLESRRVKRYRNIGGVLKKVSPESLTLLDVGSGTGVGTKALQDMGFKVTGIEPDTRAALAGIEILPYTIEEYNQKSSQQFDIVTFVHSLEHIYDPKKVIGEIVKKVKDGGFLYIEVPDAHNIGFFDYTHLAHVSYFNFRNLAHLLAEFGFAASARLYPKSNPWAAAHLGVLFQKGGNAIAAKALAELTPPKSLLQSFKLNIKKPYEFKTDNIENILNNLQRCRILNEESIVFDFTKVAGVPPSKKQLAINMLKLFVKDPLNVGSYLVRKALGRLTMKYVKDPFFEAVRFER